MSETDRQTDRQTQTQTEIETETETRDISTKIDYDWSDRDKNRYRETGERPTGTQYKTCRQINRNTCNKRNRHRNIDVD